MDGLSGFTGYDIYPGEGPEPDLEFPRPLPSRLRRKVPLLRVIDCSSAPYPRPDELEQSSTSHAFDDAMRRLRLADRADPATEVVAKKIIELAQRGKRDPLRLSEGAIQALSQ
jgi:hypothetical protein